MKKLLFISALIALTSCHQTKKQVIEPSKSEMASGVEKMDYPENLTKVFSAHGGLDLWKKQRTLIYEMPKPDNPETHTTDLWSRKDRIDTPNYMMGFDGVQPWLLNTDGAYEGNVEFYHNLMFYFYAMPFVLADDGIKYADTEALQFEGQNYPGIQITYDDGVGTSPKDEYYLHFNPETHQMEWLGYTVTYRTGEDSDNIKWIRYNDWTTVNGLVLPQSISWYNYENRTIKDLRSRVPFTNITVSEAPQPKGFYHKPEEATYFNKEAVK